MSLRQGNNIIAGSPDEHRVIEFQAPTAANNYTWYRWYADGWVEQGGYLPRNSTFSIQTVVFPVRMADSYYCLTITSDGDQAEFTNTAQASQRGCSKAFSFNRSAAGFGCQSHNNVTWRVEGMAA